MIPLILIVKDFLSEAVARKILEASNKNYEIEYVLFWNKEKITGKIGDINKSAKGYGYFVLTDQDTADRCPPNAIRELPEPVHPNLLYRFAVMEIESWVMAHRDAISTFLRVPLSKIPADTDTISNPKEHLINLAKQSRIGRIKRDIAPLAGSTSKVGPDYNGRLIEFIWKCWDVKIASKSSPSLQRTLKRLKQFTVILPG